MKPRLSFSSLDRVRACPASASMPRVNDQSAHSLRGKALHAVVASAEPVETLLREHPEFAPFADEMRALPPPVPGKPEYSVALNVETGTARRIGSYMDRNYGPLEPGEIPGTVDAWHEDVPVAVITDYKFGFGTVRARGNLQLGAAAVAMAKLHPRAREIRGILVRIATWDGGADFSFDEEFLDSLAIDAIEGEIGDLYARAMRAARHVEKQRADVTEGEHCRFCPAWHGCPAKAGLIREVVALVRNEADPIDRYRAVLERDPAEAYRVWERVRSVASQMAEALHGWASEHPIDLGDGLVFGPVSTSKRRVDPGRALPVLRDALGDAAEKAFEIETSQAAIKRAWQAAPRAARPTFKAVMERLVAVQAIETVEKTEIKVHRTAAGLEPNGATHDELKEDA